MKTLRTHVVIAVVVPLIFLGGIGAAKMAGWWLSARGRVPAMISEGRFAGMYNPADIRGSSLFREVEQFFGVPAALIAEAFAIEAEDPGSISAKYIDIVYGEVTTLDGEMVDIGTDALKFFVARMTGLPYEPEEDTGLPQTAVDTILTLGAGMTDAQREQLLRREAPAIASVFEGAVVAQTAADLPADTAFAFQGRTTFAEVMAQGVSLAQIERVLGKPMGARTQSVRDYCEQEGLSYSSVRNALTELMQN